MNRLFKALNSTSIVRIKIKIRGNRTKSLVGKVRRKTNIPKPSISFSCRQFSVARRRNTLFAEFLTYSIDLADEIRSEMFPIFTNRPTTDSSSYYKASKRESAKSPNDNKSPNQYTFLRTVMAASPTKKHNQTSSRIKNLKFYNIVLWTV